MARNRRFLEDFNHEIDELPLGHNRQSARIRDGNADQVNTIKLIHSRQREKEENERKESPVPQQQVCAYLANHVGLR